jgi:glyoxylase-like metal-dependent hydrolase (beta-lactamase superfamily II)
MRGAARGVLAAALLTLAPSFTASAEAASLHAETVAPGLYRIEGGGAGTLLRLSANGPVVVDSKSAGNYGPLMAEVRRIAKTSDRPVRALLLTAAGPEQAGNAEQFAAAGVPVIVQQRALARLVGDARAGTVAVPMPAVIYDNDYVLRDCDVEIEFVGSGRTGADSVVLFRDLRVLAIGELFTAGTPQPDSASGGSFAGWAAAIDHLMWLDFDVAVPSHGTPVGKRELAVFKAKLEALAQRSR